MGLQFGEGGLDFPALRVDPSELGCRGRVGSVMVVINR